MLCKSVNLPLIPDFLCLSPVFGTESMRASLARISFAFPSLHLLVLAIHLLVLLPAFPISSSAEVLNLVREHSQTPIINVLQLELVLLAGGTAPFGIRICA